MIFIDGQLDLFILIILQSNPVFSNALSHGFQAGVISGRVISGTLYYSFPVFKATIFCGSNYTTTDVAGYYNLIVPSGTYNVSASARCV
jgi:hypothetical protein